MRANGVIDRKREIKRCERKDEKGGRNEEIERRMNKQKGRKRRSIEMKGNGKKGRKEQGDSGREKYVWGMNKKKRNWKRKDMRQR